jgi:NADH-quinone oxidoreductase subunit M
MMDLGPILSMILLLPTATALILLLLPREEKGLLRWTALVGSLVPLLLAMYLWLNFNPSGQGFQFVEKMDWYPSLNASYHLGVDGLSLTMVLLTTLLTPIAILASFNVEDRSKAYSVKAYMILFLLLETGMLGVFLALDLLLFFVFWEIGLVPMYFLINQWGSEKGERIVLGRKIPARVYASFKFMIYTMAGSLGLLLAIQLIGVSAQTYDLEKLFSFWPAAQSLPNIPWGLPVPVIKQIAFWAFVIAFALKVPLWPFHTWLPDAHTEAPTAGSMILAGVLLKLGAYGFLRLVLPLYPSEASQYAPAMAFLATMAIIFGALAAYGQDDFKRLVAYSSVNHMGFVVLGIAAAAFTFGSQDPEVARHATIALNGAVLQMFNHGLSSAGMFFLVGVIYERTHTRNLNDFGGLFPLVPVYGGILIFTSMASLGLPGLNGFVSEFLVVRGAWPIFQGWTALSMIGLFFTGAYILKGIKKVLHGPMNQNWIGHLTEINPREVLVMAPLMVLILVIGVWPAWILDVINKAMQALF